LWYDTAEKYGLKVIYMPYTIDNKEYFYDLGRKTDFKDFYARIRKGSIPITSALNEYDYIEYFEPVLKAGDDIIYISFSHALSGTFASMEKAIAALKKKYPERAVTCIDTKNISSGTGLVVLEAAKLFAAGGLSDAEFIARVGGLIRDARAFFTVDDLYHLKRGGRIGGGAAMVGSILNLKPLLRLNAEGKIENFAKAKGRKKAIETLLDRAADNGIDLSRPIYLLDADAADADLFHDMFAARFGAPPNLIRQTVGPVIGTHCGPGTLGLCFLSR
jgi:DegV family protein with EDD domain